jgi:hypothetical protein
VTVLFIACLLLMPTMSPILLGAALVVATTLRTVALVVVHRRMREAHQRYNDIELSDWMLGVVLPGACYAGLLATGVGFVAERATAFTGLAVVIVTILLLGVFGAWELVIWLALTRVRSNDAAKSASES